MSPIIKSLTFVLIFYPIINFAEAKVIPGDSELTLTSQTEKLPSPAIKNEKADITQGNAISLTLQDAIRRTLANNVSIAVEEFNSKVKAESVTDSESEFDATFEIDLSVEEKTLQQSSAFSSPNKSRNKTHNWNFSLTQKLVTGADYELSFSNNRNKTNSTTAGLNPRYFSDYGFTITQPLLKDFGIDLNKRNIYIAKNEVNISDFDFENKVIDIITNVENIYWDLVFSIEDLAVKKKSLERARDLERRVKAQVSVGTMAEIETLQAKSEVASRDESLLIALDLIQDNEDNLKNILNMDFDSAEGLQSIHPSDRPEMIVEEVNLKVAIKDALANRPDYLAKKKELENKNILVKFRENQIYPSVDLIGSLGLNGLSGEAINVTSGTFTGKSKFGGGYGQALSDTLTADFFNWQFGVKLSYPLGNRSAKSNLAASRLESAKLILSIKDIEKEIIVEVREAIRQLKTDVKRVHASRIARKLAEEKLKAEEKKFEVGLSTSFNVLEFQEDLAEEQSNEIKAIIDHNKSRIRLRQVMATTLKTNNIKHLPEEKT